MAKDGIGFCAACKEVPELLKRNLFIFNRVEIYFYNALLDESSCHSVAWHVYLKLNCMSEDSFYVGTSGWSYKHWKEIFYSP